MKIAPAMLNQLNPHRSLGAVSNGQGNNIFAQPGVNKSVGAQQASHGFAQQLLTPQLPGGLNALA